MGTRAVSLALASVVIFVLAGGPYAGTAYACLCAERPSAEEGFRESGAVFSGEVIRDDLGDPDPGGDAVWGGVEFRVEESWKGVAGDSAMVYSQDPAYNSCGYLFKEGRSYLVYADRYEDGFRVEACSGTTMLAYADKDLRALGPSEQLTNTGGPVTPLRLATAAAVSLAAAVATLLIAVRRV